VREIEKKGGKLLGYHDVKKQTGAVDLKPLVELGQRKKGGVN